jgi:TolB protein
MKTLTQSIGFSLIIVVLWSLSSCNPEAPSKFTPSSYVIQGDMDTGPASSPDGNFIAYQHDDANTNSSTSYATGLYVIDRNGNNRKLVLPGVHLDPAWSPDGQWLVFSSLGVIQKCKINGDNLTTFKGLTNLKYPQFYYPDWSADGNHILFDNPFPSDGGGLFQINSNFTNAKRLFGIDQLGRNPELSFSIVSLVYYDWVKGWDFSEIFIRDTLGNSGIRLTQNNRDDRDPTWSPDGSQIAWSSNIRLRIMNANGSNQREISYGNSPSWSINNEIVFSHANADYTKEVLYIISPDGFNRKQITF